MERPNQRKVALAQTRAKLLQAARRLFRQYPYQKVSMRGIAKAMGMSTGAVYNLYDTKADVWRDAMGTPPPVEDVVIQEAHNLQRVLETMVFAYRSGDNLEPSVAAAEAALKRLNRKAKG